MYGYMWEKTMSPLCRSASRLFFKCVSISTKMFDSSSDFHTLCLQIYTCLSHHAFRHNKKMLIEFTRWVQCTTVSNSSSKD